MKQLTHRVPVDTPPERIDKYLTRVTGLSRSHLLKLVEQERVSISGRPVKPSHPIKPGEEIVITIPDPVALDVKPEPIPLKILYEDDHLLVVDKPAGMVTHPSAGHDRGTLVNALLHHGGVLSGINGVMRPGIVHRLDKDTSGLLVVAKTDEAHRALAKQFEQRQVKKIYFALVKGRMAMDEGVIDAPIGRHPVDRQRQAVRFLGAKEALTRFRVVGRTEETTALEIQLHTGRTHQIRVHLAHLGHPVLGDPIYGTQRAASRLALHAMTLGFAHPVTREWIEVTSEIPKELR